MTYDSKLGCFGRSEGECLKLAMKSTGYLSSPSSPEAWGWAGEMQPLLDWEQCPRGKAIFSLERESDSDRAAQRRGWDVEDFANEGPWI